MRAEIKLIDSPDADPIEAWSPSDPSDAGALITMSIGIEDGRAGADLFDVVVGTPAYFYRIGPQRKTLVVHTWDWPTIRAELERRVASTSGESWQTVATQIASWAHWEFEEIDETTYRMN